jgi:peptide-methionine (R)-S-oxide reductase|tara:strand:+ start:1597 stop:2088 length:492 start_codon:yes stop_codon:yes gene_type:complete
MKNFILITLFLFNASYAINAQQKSENQSNPKFMKKTDAEWKKELSQEQYYILRQKGTDRPGDGGYTKHFEKGTYLCSGCNTQLFESNSKYESHCGWPSFDDAIKGTVKQTSDFSLGMIRTEITCNTCDGHLGHIFDDGPKDTTGKRYCVNTTSIKFIKTEDDK